jgi:hypothetical protein
MVFLNGGRPDFQSKPGLTDNESSAIGSGVASPFRPMSSLAAAQQFILNP